jgi:ABC-type nitrate/sulfonate/bicarbonate transport system substrate-binding protein
MALGVAEGSFAYAGLDVVMEEMPRTGDAVKRLIEGSCEFVVAGATPIINVAKAGHDPLIVMSIEAENVFAIMAAKHIRSPEDLRGQTIAISGHREQDEMIMRRTLRDWGIDPDRDVELKLFGSRGKNWDAIVSGEAAAMTAPSGFPFSRTMPKRQSPIRWDRSRRRADMPTPIPISCGPFSVHSFARCGCSKAISRRRCPT